MLDSHFAAPQLREMLEETTDVLGGWLCTFSTELEVFAHTDCNDGWDISVSEARTVAENDWNFCPVTGNVWLADNGGWDSPLSAAANGFLVVNDARAFRGSSADNAGPVLSI